ncbi:phosphopantetheine-binding protein [Nocardia sp. NBC_00565]|uniref:acyl carrier protein n=1 Tax=Nocardia sp. NBC_00565 TaxID=2975993 RepID=UPI002E7FF1B9|nr:phosphopantetheine-binding protein [Nocardia sp. NBC_00565]WUC04022.1 phosphopantetheine-binding protein [Nocardia sp. NBC_00565]
MEPLTDMTCPGITAYVTGMWCAILDVAAVGPDDNFFDLGGTSFQLLMVKDRLDTELGITTDLISFFRHPTVAELADYLYGKTR